MPETKTSALLDRLPELRKGKMPPIDPKLSTEIVTSIAKDGQAAVGALIDTLQEIDDGSDWKARFLLRNLVTSTGNPGQDQVRRQLAKTLLAEATGNRPAPIRTFLLLQLRLIADKEAVPKLIPLLSAKDAPLANAAAATLVSIGIPARPPLNAALKSAKGRFQELIEYALVQID